MEQVGVKLNDRFVEIGWDYFLVENKYVHNIVSSDH